MQSAEPKTGHASIRVVEFSETGEQRQYDAADHFQQAPIEEIIEMRSRCYRFLILEFIPRQVYAPAFEAVINADDAEAWLKAKRPEIQLPALPFFDRSWPPKPQLLEAIGSRETQESADVPQPSGPDSYRPK